MKTRYAAALVGLCTALMAATWAAAESFDLPLGEAIQTAASAFTLPVGVWFVMMYAREKWWRTAFSASLMGIAIAVILYCLSVVLARVYGLDYPLRALMLVSSSLLTFASMLARTLVLRHERRRTAPAPEPTAPRTAARPGPGGVHPCPKEISMPTFRGRPCCPCQAEWLPAFEAELQRRGLLVGPLPIYQLIGGAKASGGTHVEGGAADFVDLPGVDDVWVARQMGADATWARPKGWDGKGGIAHVHSVLTGCPHNGPARYQIDAVRAGYNGLGRGGRGARDAGPRPLSGRTWREGIAWARQEAKAAAKLARLARRRARLRAILARVSQTDPGPRRRRLRAVAAGLRQRIRKAER